MSGENRSPVDRALGAGPMSQCRSRSCRGGGSTWAFLSGAVGTGLLGSAMAAIHSRTKARPSSWISRLPSSGIMMPASVEPMRKARIDLSGLPGTMSNTSPPEPRPGGHRRLHDADERGIGLRGQQIEPRVSRGPLGIVAVGAIDLRARRGPARRACRCWDRPTRPAAAHRPATVRRSVRPARSSAQADFRSRGVSEVAIQMPGLGTDRRHGLTLPCGILCTGWRWG